ncbi:hypothetical protein STEG23_016033 [Scotinomys teguina]
MGVREEETKRIKKRQSHLSHVKVYFIDSGGNGFINKRQFVYVADYIVSFSYVEPSLYLWDEAYLIMVDDLFNVFLDSVCKYLLSIFALMFMKEIELPGKLISTQVLMIKRFLLTWSSLVRLR